MKTVITYATSCTITIYFRNGCDLASADWRETFKTLQDAIEQAEIILKDIYPHSAEMIYIWDNNTGEILAECYSERKEDD